MGTAARKVAIVARVAMTASAVVTSSEALAVEIAKTTMTASTAMTLARASDTETTKVTASDRAIVTAVSSPHEATLAIGQTRVVLSVGVARVTAVVAKTVAKTVANVMTCGVMTRGITQKKSCATISHAPLAKVAVTPGGLTRAAISGVGAIRMTCLTQGQTQCCPQLRNQRE